MSELPRQNPLELSIYTFRKIKNRKVKQVLSGDGYQWQDGEGYIR
jgi:hypothetical protein